MCSPEWLGRHSRSEGIICGLHHLIISLDDFDERVLRQWLEGRVAAIDEPTWAEDATKLGLVASGSSMDTPSPSTTADVRSAAVS